MATEFGADNTSVSEVQTSSTVKTGVSKGPSFLEGLSNVFDEAKGLLQERRAEDNTRLVSDFTRRQLLEAEAVAQGKRGTAAAQTRMRKNLIEALDANPLLASELIAAQGSVLRLPGAGKIAVDGTLEEQRTRDRNDRLVASGLAAPDATEQEFEDAALTARNAAAASARFTAEKSRIELELKQLNLTSSRRKELEAQKQDEAERFVSDNSRAEYRILEHRFEEILASDASEADKILQINEHYADWNSQVSATLGNIDSDMRSAMKAPFDMMVQNYLDRASGAINDEALERGNKRAVAQMSALALANPVIAKAVSTNQLMGSDALMKVFTAGDKNVSKALMEFMAGLDPDSSKETPSVFTDDKVSKKALDAALRAITEDIAVNGNKASEDATGSLANVLESIEDHSGQIARNPKKAIALMDWIGSSSFLKAMQANPDAFSNLDGIADVLDQHYHDEIAGLIRSQFTENNVELETDDEDLVNRLMNDEATEAAATSMVKAVGNSSGMTFTAIDPNDATAVTEAARLNKVLKPIINQSLKAQAHLAGRTDYGVVWDEVSEGIFGGQGETQTPGGDEGDDLQLDDFAPDEVTPVAATETGDFDFSSIAVGGAQRPDSFTRLEPEFRSNVASMVQAAAADGIKLTITSAYRSPELQAKLYQRALKKYGSAKVARRWVAPPGHSMHNKGMAVDFAAAGGGLLRDANSEEARWLKANADRFNLAVPLSNEPWQIEPKGARG